MASELNDIMPENINSDGNNNGRFRMNSTKTKRINGISHGDNTRDIYDAGVWSWVKTNFFPLHIVLAYVFIMSGLIVCALMLVACIVVWPFNKRLYRKIVINLAYLHWSQFTFIGQWWSGCDCTMVYENVEDFEKLGKEHQIVLMNHKYDIDWMMCWILAERMKLLGGTKVYGKSSLRFVPLLGWAWMFTESIFLKRTWDKDREIISRDLKYICDYPDNYWVSLLLFCEGTRFTEAKHQKSVEFARARGLPVLKHHLLPRTRGFVHSISGLKGKVPTILDLTVVFKPDSHAPTLMNLVKGKRCEAVMYARRIPIASVPTDTDEECSAWLYNHFVEKDNIYDQIKTTGTIQGTPVKIPRRINDLMACIAWHIILDIPLFWYGIPALLGSTTLMLVSLLIIVLGFFGIRKMIAVSEIKSSSSEYGSVKKTS